MSICGNDGAAKKTVSGLLDRFGREIADRGKAKAARAVELLRMLWCISRFPRSDWGQVFKLLSGARQR